jgi:hypothetical protein
MPVLSAAHKSKEPVQGASHVKGKHRNGRQLLEEALQTPYPLQV